MTDSPDVPTGPRPRRRDYEKVFSGLETRWKRHPVDRGRMMHEIVDALWDVFEGKPYSWVGFYCPLPDGKGLALGPHRDKPACSPIGAHGVCGRAAAQRATLVVADVKALGDAHIECDPASRSEIAVPVLDPDGTVFAVLDVDSTELGAFEEEDRRWLERIVKHLGDAPKPRQR